MREELLYEIFMELFKAYDALERDRFLYILEGYRVGPRDCRVLCAYWDRLRMVSRVGSYYGEKFKVFWGVTQGGLLSPIILNVVVDAVVHHWVFMVAGGAGNQDG